MTLFMLRLLLLMLCVNSVTSISIKMLSITSCALKVKLLKYYQ